MRKTKRIKFSKSPIPVLCMTLFFAILTVPAMSQTLTFTDNELCNIYSAEGYWEEGYNSMWVYANSISTQVIIPDTTAGCANVYEDNEGILFDVGIMLFPSNDKAQSTLVTMQQTISSLGGTTTTVYLPSTDIPGTAAWIGSFDFEEVVFIQLGPFIISGHHYLGYTERMLLSRQILLERMTEAIFNLAVIENDDKLYLFSPPGSTLILSSGDIPLWALDKIVTVGAMAGCVGPPTTLAYGDSTILLGGKPVARLSDLTVHGGIIVEGSDRIFVNGKKAAVLGGFHVCPMVTGIVPHVGGPIITNGWSEDPLASETDRLKQSKLNSNLCTDSARLKLGALYDAGGALAEWCTQTLKTLNKPASKGDTVLEVDDDGIEVGDTVVIGSEPDKAETAKVTDKGSLVLDRPLENNYPVDTIVTPVPDEFANGLPGDDDDDDDDSGGGGGGGGGGCFIEALNH